MCKKTIAKIWFYATYHKMNSTEIPSSVVYRIGEVNSFINPQSKTCLFISYTIISLFIPLSKLLHCNISRKFTFTSRSFTILVLRVSYSASNHLGKALPLIFLPSTINSHTPLIESSQHVNHFKFF